MKKTAKRVVKSSENTPRKATAAAPKSAARVKKASVVKAKRTTSAAAPSVTPAPSERAGKNALEAYSAAVEAFRSGDFEKAKALFDEVAATSTLEMAHAARNYSRMCDARIGRQRAEPRTAEEFYTYGIALTNQRKLQEAKANLEQAARLSPRADHIYYALALCHALSGDYEAAAGALRTAIELNPGNRSLARNDPDFHEFVRKRPLAEVLSRA